MTELLVAISILVTGRIRQVTHKGQSASNLRQLATAMNEGPRDGASYCKTRHALLAAASDLPVPGTVETDKHVDKSAGSPTKTYPQSSGFLQSFRNFFNQTHVNPTRRTCGLTYS